MSFIAYFIELRQRFELEPSSGDTSNQWKDLALSLEQRMQDAVAEIDKYKNGMCSFASCAVIPIPALTELSQLKTKSLNLPPPGNSSFGGSPNRTSGTKKKKKTSASRSRPGSQPLPVPTDWTRLIDKLKPGDICSSTLHMPEIYLFAELCMPSLKDDLDILSCLRANYDIRIPLTPSNKSQPQGDDIFIPSQSLITRIMKAMASLLSTAVTGKNHRTAKVQAAEALSILLPSFMSDTLSLLITSDLPDSLESLLSTTLHQIMVPTIASFKILSRQWVTSANETSGQNATQASSISSDVRPYLLNTLDRVLQVLQATSGSLVPKLVLPFALTVAHELHLLITYDSSTDRNIPHNGHASREKDFNRECQRYLLEFAMNDALWYLSTCLNLCFDRIDSFVSIFPSDSIEDSIREKFRYQLTVLASAVYRTDLQDSSQPSASLSAQMQLGQVQRTMLLSLFEKAWLRGLLDGPAVVGSKTPLAKLLNEPEEEQDVDMENSEGICEEYEG